MASTDSAVGPGKVAVVTGAGSGMGRSIALAFAARGALVCVVDIERDAAQSTVDEIVSQGGHGAAYAVDVSDFEAVKAVADAIYAAHGRVDVLCNNAGVTMRPFRAIWDGDISDFRWMMEINYFGIVHGVLAFVPRMRAQDGHRHIINTSSFSSLDEVPGHGMYSASKGAVDAFSEVLRAEFKDHGEDIGVTILYPGYVPTRIGSSERLRKADERSDARDVKAYAYPLERKAHNTPIPAETVGAMVVEAIDRNLAYCLTHPAPVDALNARVRNWERGHLDTQPAAAIHAEAEGA